MQGLITSCCYWLIITMESSRYDTTETCAYGSGARRVLFVHA